MTSISKAIQSDVLANADRLNGRSHPLSDALPTLRQQIKQGMEACRNSTLALFNTVDYETFCQQAHPDFSPIGWHLGHIAYTESLWLLEHSAGLPPQFPPYRRLFAADSLPKTERVYLPDLAEVQAYLQTVRNAVFAYLETAPLDKQERLWRWLLQHESQHGETIALVLELIRSHESVVSGHESQVTSQDQLKTQNSKLKTQNSKLKTQNSKLKTLPPSPLPPSPFPALHSRRLLR
ncbi:MAG: DinB family protein, partial [Verrucomicrobia bacterium]|nr:DinB family protein [Leptolyngbya sp. ES-bin-22]